MTDFLNPHEFEGLKVNHGSRELRLFSTELFELIGIRFEDTSELERQVIAAFCFGALNAIVQRDELNQPQAHALIVALLINEFKYSEKQAVDFAEDLIHATNKEYHPVMNAIIHRGIDGHYQYEKNMLDNLRHNILEVINTVKKKA
ncbi:MULTISPECIES: Imm48 family immunity protein [unclassified Paenibacillus]|uniref:Imm48 family immunity protein n=1 Tax=unclassified Paenibacillus TaxID=185978 RepID=UPI0030FBEBE1